MLGTGLVLLLSVGAAITLLCVVLGRYSGGAIALLTGLALITVLTIVMFSIPQESAPGYKRTEESIAAHSQHSLKPPDDKLFWVRLGVVVTGAVGALLATIVFILNCTHTRFATPLPMRPSLTPKKPS